MSSSEQKQLRKSLNKAQKVAKRLTSSSESKRRRRQATGAQLRRQFGSNIATVGIAVIAVWVATILLGVPINLTGVATLAAIGIVFSFATDRFGTFQLGFWMATIGFAGALIDVFVPANLAAVFSFVQRPLLDVPVVGTTITVFQSLSPLEKAALGFSLATAVWLIWIRAGSALARASGQPEAVKPGTVARALTRRYERLFEAYVDIGTAFAVLGFTLAGVAAAGALVVLGEAFGIINSDPVGVVAFVNTFLGYVISGGPFGPLENLVIIGPILQVIAGLSPIQYGVIFGVVGLGLAYAAREANS